MPQKKRYGFVIDVERCIDCRACLVACSVENKVPMDHTRIWVHDLGLKGEFPDLERTFVPYNCMHCENPPCVDVCVSGATYKDPENGLVLVDQEACIGCGFCVEACPYDSRYLDEERGVMDKCNACLQRVEVGQKPACVTTCLGGSRMFGDLNDPASEVSIALKNARGIQRLDYEKDGHDTDPNIYFINPSHGLPIVTQLSELINSTWPYDMEITGIDSLSGTYHFGIMSQHLFGITDLFPVLVVDSTQPGVYDTVYVDLSFDWWWWNFTTVYDASFSDETALTPTGRTIAARDFTGDGIYDISAGSLGYFLDIWSVSPNANDRGLILEPIDQNGNYAVFVNDWWGHGTQCASSVGGRNKRHPLTGPGIAPEVKIMGIVALWIGDIIEAELWAAGFDLIP